MTKRTISTLGLAVILFQLIRIVYHTISNLEKSPPSFLITVIIPFYNVEQYLNTCISSVLSQTIGLSCIEVLLIDDGSTDNSSSIALSFSNLYKHNIFYFRQQNEGPGSARNHGLRYTHGKYVTFLDSDDYWAPDAFERIVTKFEEWKNVDVVLGRMKRFELYNTYHPLSYQFNQTGVVDLLEHYNVITVHVNSVFFLYSSIQSDRFITSVNYAEDCHFVNRVLMRKCCVGYVEDAIYFRRMRYQKSSLIFKEPQTISFYLTIPTAVFEDLLEKSLTQYHVYLPFIQTYVMCEIANRFLITPSILSFSQLCDYRSEIKTLLQRISDELILQNRDLQLYGKMACLHVKHGANFKNVTIRNGSICYRHFPLLTLNDVVLSITTIQLVNASIVFEGYDNLWIKAQDYHFSVSYQRSVMTVPVSDVLMKSTLFGNYKQKGIIQFRIPRKKHSVLRFSISMHSITSQIRVRFNESTDNTFYLAESYTISLINSTMIIDSNKKRSYSGQLLLLLVRLIVFIRKRNMVQLPES